MDLNELAEAIARRMECSAAEASDIVFAFTCVVAEALKERETVEMMGFGSFSVRVQGERVGRHPVTGEKSVIPGRKTVIFNAGRDLREFVAHPKGAQVRYG